MGKSCPMIKSVISVKNENKKNLSIYLRFSHHISLEVIKKRHKFISVIDVLLMYVCYASRNIIYYFDTVVE